MDKSDAKKLKKMNIRLQKRVAELESEVTHLYETTQQMSNDMAQHVAYTISLHSELDKHFGRETINKIHRKVSRAVFGIEMYDA